jgi:hypothetical protein
VQIAADRSSAAIQRPPPRARPGPGAPPVDLTQLAVAQTNAKMTASAGAALAQVTGELTGTLVNISVYSEDRRRNRRRFGARFAVNRVTSPSLLNTD